MVKEEMPLVSVVVPTYNRRDFLREALESIHAQTYRNIEIIVVNDGGDDVSDLITAHKNGIDIKYIFTDRTRGPAASRNRGLNESEGKYIAYLDDDDIYYPDHLEILVGALEGSHNKVAYSDSYQAFRMLDKDRYVTAEKKLVYSEDFNRQRLLVMNYIPTINIVHCRDCIEHVGFFDEDLETHEDWDFWIRLSQEYEFYHVKAVTSEFRTRSDSKSSTFSKRSDFLRTMKIIHKRYAFLADNEEVISQQHFIENELEKEVSLKGGGSTAAGKLTVINAKTGSPSLRVLGDDGTRKTLHSLYDPESEAKSIVKSFEYDGKGILVILGLGLGYHVAALAAKFPEADMVIIEALPEIYSLALEQGPKVNNKVTFITGLTPDDSLRRITEHQVKRGMPPLAVFKLSSAVSAYPAFYRPILESLNNVRSVRLWDRLRYKKFREDKVRVLLIDSGYFLLKEAEKALLLLGHEVMSVQITNDDKGELILSSFVEAIVNYKPDFILTINHLGFDENGALASFFSSIELPVASWYVDSPRLIVGAFNKNVSPWMSLFLWDRSYLSEMAALGYESLLHLPLGTDDSIFRPLTARKHRKKLAKYACDAGFVGNSMVDPVNKYFSRLNEGHHGAINRIAETSLNSCSSPETAPALLQRDREVVENMGEREKMDFEAAVIWKRTLLYRVAMLRELEKFDTVVHGDKGWNSLLKNSTIRLEPPLNYYKELTYFYNACAINFNATSRQMREAVNQRVFDVPACGAFLLTDYQAALDDLFRVGKEIITYKHKDEIPEIVKFYMKYPLEREKISLKGRERVLKEHTYKHRLKDLISSMRKRYA